MVVPTNDQGRGRPRVWYFREPTITEILSDSIVRAVMRADRVDPEILERDLRSIAVQVSEPKPTHCICE
jgi:hypothetical protein